MKQDIVIYHGSQQIVEVPQFGVGKKYNDYGQGFYCTENSELAKEWACPIKNDGYSNKYHLSPAGLNVMHLTKGEFNIQRKRASRCGRLFFNFDFRFKRPLSSQAHPSNKEHGRQSHGCSWRWTFRFPRESRWSPPFFGRSL